MFLSCASFCLFFSFFSVDFLSMKSLEPAVNYFILIENVYHLYSIEVEICDGRSQFREYGSLPQVADIRSTTGRTRTVLHYKHVLKEMIGWHFVYKSFAGYSRLAINISLSNRKYRKPTVT